MGAEARNSWVRPEKGDTPLPPPVTVLVRSTPAPRKTLTPSPKPQSVSNCRRVRDTGISSLVTCLKLTRLFVSGCPHVSDASARVLARKPGHALFLMSTWGTAITEAGVNDLKRGGTEVRF